MRRLEIAQDCAVEVFALKPQLLHCEPAECFRDAWPDCNVARRQQACKRETLLEALQDILVFMRARFDQHLDQRAMDEHHQRTEQWRRP